jgi:mRNA-degrading endonuclease RelE of RelBE toxin-antitoxin system
MAYIMSMEIIETPVFTKQIIALLPDDEYKKLQHYLICRPDAGALIVGGGGLRKLRWSLPGRGKSGGVRTIYYWDQQDGIFMLFCYLKNEQENLTPKQLSILRAYIKEYLL